jgi:hypothetical protein
LSTLKKQKKKEKETPYFRNNSDIKPRSIKAYCIIVSSGGKNLLFFTKILLQEIRK